MVFSPSTRRKLHRTRAPVLEADLALFVVPAASGLRKFQLPQPSFLYRPGIRGNAVNTASMMEAVVGHAVWAICSARGGVQRDQDALHVVPAWQPFAP